MFYPLEVKLMFMVLGCVWGLDDMVVSSPELMAHVGDSALLCCIFPSTVKKEVTKMYWMFSAGEHAQEEFVLYYFANLSVPVGHFKDRVSLVGKISDSDGSILLQDVREADQGVYTCEIQVHREINVFKKTTMLRVVPAKPTTLKPTEAFRTDGPRNYQHVIIVGIVCFTVILLAILGVTMRRSRRQHRSESHMENTSKAKPEVHAHIYSTITPQSVIEEEESSRSSETTYMTMLPVWPSQRAEQNKSSEVMPETKQTLGRALVKEDNISQ
ncbi:junctional adhesion molecule-like [Dromiciops gliroides]|uniref:junctional adhesion molecule-like n=1 Tax=Dromiciops gliroides TaxID=33562 RepID=UPI001CC7219B|nr:junctional adhesion molecule-like [Dromiciops gliroides]XP_043851118.1 junctional adhesion molecule-like [Dromiciops gliroides]